MIARLARTCAERLAGLTPLEVRLFGSWARGDFDGDSDIDLALIGPPDVTAIAVGRLAGFAAELERHLDLLEIDAVAYRDRSRRPAGLWRGVAEHGITVLDTQLAFAPKAGSDLHTD